MSLNRPHTRRYFLGTTLTASLGIAGQGFGRQAQTNTVRYRVVDLGTLPKCNETYATGVNDSGWVVGFAFAGPGHGSDLASRPFLWRNGTLTELAKLGGEYGQALTINAQGDIGGYVTAKDMRQQPVI